MPSSFGGWKSASVQPKNPWTFRLVGGVVLRFGSREIGMAKGVIGSLASGSQWMTAVGVHDDEWRRIRLLSASFSYPTPT